MPQMDPLASTTARLSISQADAESRDEFRKLVESAVQFTDDKPKVKKGKRRRLSKAPTPKTKKRAHKDPRIQYHSDTYAQVDALRNVIMEVFTNQSRGSKPRGILVENPKQLDKVVVCLVGGLTLDDFGVTSVHGNQILTNELKMAEELDFFKSFEYLIRSKSAGSKDAIYPELEALTKIRMTKRERQDAIAKMKAQPLVIDNLLLLEEEMRANGYEIHGTDREGWLDTRDFEHEGSRTFSVDCEFCKAGTEKVLTRISIVNFQEEVVLDTLVQPKQDITDYVTAFSGITKEKLEGVTTTLEEVRETFLAMVLQHDVLIGHSLDSDLGVLKIRHPRVIDTSVCYDHERGPPAKPLLKYLAKTYLGEVIQAGEALGEGHSLVEDALACLRLVKRKLVEGAHFGRVVAEASLFEVLQNYKSRDIKAAFVTDREQLIAGELHVERLTISNDDEAVAHVANTIDTTDLVILKLHENKYSLGWYRAPTSYGELPEKQPKELLARLNNQLRQIYKCLPPRTLFVVSVAHGDTKRIRELQLIRDTFRRMERAGTPGECESWDFDKMTELRQHVASAREGALFALVTTEPTAEVTAEAIAEPMGEAVALD